MTGLSLMVVQDRNSPNGQNQPARLHLVSDWAILDYEAGTGSGMQNAKRPGNTDEV